MKRYDFRKNGKFYFSQEEILSDPVLKRIARRLKVQEGGLEVTAKNSSSAFRKFFGVLPYNARELPEEICPGMNETYNGWTSDVYAILPESSW
jgi:hypothetical protein